MGARVLGAAVLLLLAISCYAQNLVEGSVHAPDHRVVPGATVKLEGAPGSAAVTATSDANGRFHFAAVPAGALTLTTKAPGFFPAAYTFTLRPRQAVNLMVELQPERQVRQEITVRSTFQTMDPEKTGSSYTFTHRDLESLPDPLTEDTNELVNNLMPGASDSPRQFSRRRGTGVFAA